MGHSRVQSLSTFRSIVCTVVDKQSLQLPQKRLHAAIQCKCVEESWLTLVIPEVVSHSNEKLQPLRRLRVQPNVIHVEDAQTF